MKAVILAAGVGRRLRPHTDEVPKCLLEVAGRTLLDRLLDHCAEAGVGPVVVVTGYRHERMRAHLAHRSEVRLAHNPRYAETNNAVSLLVAREAVGDDGFVLLDGDLLLRQNLVPLVMQPQSCLLVDRRPGLGAEEMKVVLDSRHRVLSISKKTPPQTAHGEYMGLAMLARPEAAALWPCLQQVGEGDYYEDALQLMIDRGAAIRAVAAPPDGCAEIDDAEDLARVRASFG